MSKFSGKFDLYDYLHIHNFSDEDIKNNLHIYIGDRKKPLKIKDRKDLIPYYAYVPNSDSYDKVNKIAVLHLTHKSWVDIEEEESLSLSRKEILKIYNKCKKKNIPFNDDEVLNQIYHTKVDIETYKELIKRVEENGSKSNIKGLHLIRFKYLRDRLHSEMEINGCLIPV